MKKNNYQGNIRVIEKHYPELVPWLNEAEPVKWAYQSKDGHNLFVDNGNGFKPVYDIDEPKKEARAAYNNETVKLHRQNVTVIIGAGVGHLIKLFLKRMEKGHQVIVVEPVAWLARLFLEKYNCAKYIDKGSLFICPTTDDVSILLSLIDMKKSVEQWGVLIEPHVKMRPEYGDITAAVMDAINQVQCNTGTVAGNGMMIAKNDIQTLPYVIRHRGVVELIDLFKGKPAVLVSTGPSLARNIHLLKEVQDKVIVVAVAQALRPLLAYDIRPDFICSVDFGEVNMSHLAGLLDEDVPLVTINRTYAPLVQKYKGPKFISANVEEVLRDKAQGLMIDKGTLPQGGSVAHMCLGLAAVMGCEPLVMIGQDLALSDKSHIPQADSMGKVEVKDGQINWVVEDPRSSLCDEKKSYSMGPEQYVPGYFGEPVLTNTGLIAFITSFQHMVKSFHGHVIDATEGGAYIEGTEPMYLSETLEKYCTEVIDKSVLTPLLTLCPDADDMVKAAKDRIVEDVKILDKVISHCNVGLDTNRTITGMVNDGQWVKDIRKLEAVMATNEKHSLDARAEAEKNPLLGMTIHGLVRKMSVRELNVPFKGPSKQLYQTKNKGDMLIRLKRNKSMLEGAKKAAKDLHELYLEAGMVLAKYIAGDKTALDPVGEVDPPNLDDAEVYFSQGNFARPLLEAKRIVDIEMAPGGADWANAQAILHKAHDLRRLSIIAANVVYEKEREEKRHLIPRYFYLINKGQALGKTQKDYTEARALLEEAMELQPDRMEARWGLASACYFMEDDAEAIKHYKILMEKFPDIPEFEYELGQTYLSTGDHTGFKHISNVMAKTDKFYSFLPKLSELYVKTGDIVLARQALELYLTENETDEKIQQQLKELKD